MEHWMVHLYNLQLSTQVSLVSQKTPSKRLFFWTSRIKERMMKTDGNNPTGKGDSSGHMVLLQELLQPCQLSLPHPCPQYLCQNYLTSWKIKLITINWTSSELWHWSMSISLNHFYCNIWTDHLWIQCAICWEKELGHMLWSAQMTQWCLIYLHTPWMTQQCISYESNGTSRLQQGDIHTLLAWNSSLGCISHQSVQFLSCILQTWD